MRFRGAFLASACVFVCIAFFIPSSLAESDEELLSLWTRTYDLRGALGYKHNLLQSGIRSENSAFWRTSADFFLLRIPADGLQVTLLLTGDDTRYFSGESVTHEDTALANFEVRKELEDGWTPGFSAQYLYQDQVFDTSLTETNRLLLPSVGNLLVATPFFRKSLPNAFYVEIRTPIMRQFLKSPLDDYWQGGPRVIFGRSFSKQFQASLTLDHRFRWYDRNAALDENAFPLGKRLLEQQYESGLEATYLFGEKNCWKSVSRAAFLASRDNGGGYFDYDRYSGVETVSFKPKTWDLSATARLNYYDYLVQHVDFTDPRRRSVLDVDLTLRAQKHLSERWHVFGEFEHEWSISRVRFDDYQVNTILAGVELEF